MSHAIWKGSLSFGLVNIPVNLYAGEQRENFGFTMLDKRDTSPIGYKKINKRTGEEVAKENIVKGYEYDEGRYVLVTDEDFKRAAPEKTQRVEIVSFVEAAELDPVYLSSPYYLEPAGKSDKAYALLREALRRSGKAGIATVVVRAKQYVAAVLPRANALILLLLRYAQELRDPEELKLPADAKKLKISEAELKMAQRLIDDLAAPWDPAQFKDEYRAQLLDFIKKKAESGHLEEIALPEKESKAEAPADIMKLLKASVAHLEAGKPRGARGRVLH